MEQSTGGGAGAAWGGGVCEVPFHRPLSTSSIVVVSIFPLDMIWEVVKQQGLRAEQQAFHTQNAVSYIPRHPQAKRMMGLVRGGLPSRASFRNIFNVDRACRRFRDHMRGRVALWPSPQLDSSPSCGVDTGRCHPDDTKAIQRRLDCESPAQMVGESLPRWICGTRLNTELTCTSTSSIQFRVPVRGEKERWMGTCQSM